MSRRGEQHRRGVSLLVTRPCVWFLFFFFIVGVFRLYLPVMLCLRTLAVRMSSCARWEQSRGLNSASVFRCTNGITEAKMAGGERWVHREQQTAPHRCCCCCCYCRRSAKPLDCDGMGRVWDPLCTNVCVRVRERTREGKASEWEVLCAQTVMEGL